jgi:hypothetical protein
MIIFKMSKLLDKWDKLDGLLEIDMAQLETARTERTLSKPHSRPMTQRPLVPIRSKHNTISDV